MNLIQQINSEAYQKQSLILNDGSQIIITISFKPMQYGWFIDELVYKTFILRGYRIFTSPNMLQKFKNQIPFGIACFTTDLSEPMLADDFTNERCKMYLLTSAEVALYTGLLNG